MPPRGRTLTPVVLALGLLLLAGCGPDEASTAQAPASEQAPSPEPAPASAAESPFPGLVLEVSRRSAEGPAQALAWPARAAPRYVDGSRRAWILAPLFQQDPAALWDAELVVLAKDGTRTSLPQAFRGGGPHAVWALEAGPEGRPRIRSLDPADPFGPERPAPTGGAPTRIEDVARLRIVLHGTVRRTAGPKARRADGSSRGRLKALTILRDGRPVPLPAAGLTTLESVRVLTPGSNKRQEAWDLRALVRLAGGADARLIRVAGETGEPIAIQADAWADATRMPVVRLNRRDQWKFHWSLADGGRTDGPELRGVTTLEIVTR